MNEVEAQEIVDKAVVSTFDDGITGEELLNIVYVTERIVNLKWKRLVEKL